MTLDITDFRDIHAEEPVLLLGNGPSIDHIDLSQVAVRTIGMNRSWRRHAAEYHCCFSRMPYLHEIDRGLHDPPVLFVASTGAEEVLRWMRVHLSMDRVVVIPRASSPHTPWAAFPSKGWWGSLTGVFAIRIAVWMGFNPIYLVGYDSNRDERHFNTNDLEGPFMDSKDRPQDGRNNVKHFSRLAEILAIAKPDLEIFNLNDASSIVCWPTADPQVILKSQ